MAWAVPLLYVALAAVAMLLPESRFPELDYLNRNHHKTFPLEWVTALIALWTLSLIPWIALAERRGRGWSWTTLAAPLGAVICLGIWIRPPFTHDVYVYACQGREVTVFGVSPYLVPMAAFERDGVIGNMSRTWYQLTSTFGPLAVGIFAISSLLAPAAGLHGLGRVLKTFWVLAYSAVFRLFWQRWDTVPLRTAMMLCIFANPVFLTLVFLEGHVDIVFMLFLLLTGLALERRDPVPAALWLCAATTIKISSIVMVPACACWLFHKDRKRGVTFFLLFLASYGLCSAAINAGDLRSFMKFTATHANVTHLQCFPRLLFHLGAADPVAIRKASDLFFYSVIGLLCLANLTGRGRSSPFATMAISTAALYFTRTYSQPWYTFWFWPLLWFTCKRPRELYVSVGLWTVSMLLAFIYWRTWLFGPWVTLGGFLISLLWAHREVPEAPPNEASRPPAPSPETLA